MPFLGFWYYDEEYVIKHYPPRFYINHIKNPTMFFKSLKTNFNHAGVFKLNINKNKGFRDKGCLSLPEIQKILFIL